MQCVSAYTRESRPYSANLSTPSLTLDSLLGLTFLAERKTHGCCITPGTMACGDFSSDCTFWDERGRRLTRQPVFPLVDAATTSIVMSKARVGSRRFSSRCYTFWRTHTIADPIRLLCISLALPLTLSIPSRYSPSARLMVCVSPRAL